MQGLEVSGAVRPLSSSLDVKRLNNGEFHSLIHIQTLHHSPLLPTQEIKFFYRLYGPIKSWAIGVRFSEPDLLYCYRFVCVTVTT